MEFYKLSDLIRFGQLFFFGPNIFGDFIFLGGLITRQAKHHFWFILLTKGKKSFVTLIFSPGLGICNYCPNMKYGVHRTGGAKVPHI